MSNSTENYLKNYILVGKTPVRCDDFKKWHKAFINGPRKLVETERDRLVISTVFLGINHQYNERDLILFETMAFRTPEFEQVDCERYSNWDDAITGHVKMCQQFFGEYEESDLFLDQL